jgi:hypothetical protein
MTSSSILIIGNVMSEITAHHYSMMGSISPGSAVSAMAAAMLPVKIAPDTVPTTAPNESGLPHKCGQLNNHHDNDHDNHQAHINLNQSSGQYVPSDSKPTREDDGQAARLVVGCMTELPKIIHGRIHDANITTSEKQGNHSHHHHNSSGMMQNNGTVSGIKPKRRVRLPEEGSFVPQFVISTNNEFYNLFGYSQQEFKKRLGS